MIFFMKKLLTDQFSYMTKWLSTKHSHLCSRILCIFLSEIIWNMIWKTANWQTIAIFDPFEYFYRCKNILSSITKYSRKKSEAGYIFQNFYNILREYFFERTMWMKNKIFAIIKQNWSKMVPSDIWGIVYVCYILY